MTKLSDTQLVILSGAAAREDGAALVPERPNKAAVSRAGTTLVTRKFMREVRSQPGMPVWRKDGEGRTLSLVILRAGRDAIGVEKEIEQPATTIPLTDARAATSQQRPMLRPGTKQAVVVAMLSGAQGATLDDLVQKTGWLPHTTRAALTGLRKRGFRIERQKGEDGSVYRIVTEAQAAA